VRWRALERFLDICFVPVRFVSIYTFACTRRFRLCVVFVTSLLSNQWWELIACQFPSVMQTFTVSRARLVMESL
jgi:hypothetical protein